MKLQVNFQAIDLAHRSGRELLRLVVGDTNVASLAVWCPRCWLVQGRDDAREPYRWCPRCGEVYVQLDDRFWTSANGRIKGAIRKDPRLLQQVKAECLSLRQDRRLHQTPPYALPGPLSWLASRWAKARRPEGKPFDPGIYYRLACMVRVLEEMGLAPHEIRAVTANRNLQAVDPDCRAFTEKERSDLSQEFFKCLGRSLTLQELKLMLRYVRKVLREGMPKAEAMERIKKQIRLRVEDGQSSHIVGSIADRLGVVPDPISSSLTEEQRRELSKTWEESVGRFFDPGEIRRTLRWVQHQQEDRVTRLRGERVKETRELDPDTAQAMRRVSRTMPQPTMRDEFRFDMVGLWVRQEGFTKDEATEWMVKCELEAEWIRTQDMTTITKEQRAERREKIWLSLSEPERQSLKEKIDQSVERVEQYRKAVATELEIPWLNPELYWQPGLLRDQLNKLSSLAPSENKRL